MAIAFELPIFCIVVEINMLQLSNIQFHLSFINARATLLSIIIIYSSAKYLLFIKLFTVHNNYLPLIKILPINDNYLPLIRLFTVIFKFVNSKENNLIYLVLTRRRKNKWILIGIVYWESFSHLSSFVPHVVKTVKLDAQEKLFVLTTFSRFMGLCIVSIMQCMELLDKN